MRSLRKIRYYIYAMVVLLGLVFWYKSSGTRSLRQSAQFMKTLEKNGEQDRVHRAATDELHNRVQEAANVAKERLRQDMSHRFKATKEQHHVPELEVVKEKVVNPVPQISVPVQEMGKDQKMEVQVEENQQEKVKEKRPTVLDDDEEEDIDAYDPHTELDSILRRAPVIIFSKSYCPYSAAAKHILLAEYFLNPAPYIVELDQHPHGVELQAFLKDKTGRGTVPNVLVNGRSIGGGDEVKKLHTDRELMTLLRKLGGKRLRVEESDRV